MMEKDWVEDELALDVSTESKRQKICKQLEKYKADTSQLLKNFHDHLDMVVEKRFREVKLKNEEIRILNLELGDIKNKIKEQTGKLEEKAEEIKAKENELGNKKKELDLLRNQIKLEETKLVELRRSVKDAQIEFELKNKELRPRSSVLVKHEQKQPAVAKTELVIAHESSLGSSPDHRKVSRVLRTITNPREYVLSLVEEKLRDAHQREESGLQDSVVKNLIPLFQELPEIGGSVNIQLRLKAIKVATEWKGKIRIEAPRSSLEALAFLLFIVAYGLKNLINKEETALLATSILHYEQGPGLFDELGLGNKIPDVVRGLINDRQYIPAVRIICLFELKDFSASTLLMVEISELRRSALEIAESKGVGKLRAIVELVEDYKLDISIPGDLIAKLLFRRENPSPPMLQCSVITPNKNSSSSSTPQATSSPNLVGAATRSNANLLVPKREVIPVVSPSANGRL